MKKLITKAFLIIFVFGIAVTLILNFFLQMFFDIKEFEKNSSDYFYQIDKVIRDNNKKLEEIKADFAESCIIRARAAAYITKQNPKIVEDRTQCAKVAALLQVDEIHFFNTDGEIYAGTHPKYYGYSFESGEQMEFFAQMLEDRKLELCQDITPNTAEQKLMQYAAVWCEDGDKIVQIGLTPERVLEAIEGSGISDVFALISCNPNTTFYAIDPESGVILGDTNNTYIGKKAAEIGLDVSDATEELSGKFCKMGNDIVYCVTKKDAPYIFVHTTLYCELFSGLMGEMFLLGFYIIVMFLLLLIAGYSYLDKRIIRNIANINASLKEIEHGNYNVILIDNSTKEFAELCYSINSMTESLLTFTNKISKALEISELPIGICEYDMKRHKMMATSRVKDILRMTEEEYSAFMENPNMLEEKCMERFSMESTLGPHTYRMTTQKDTYIRIELFSYEESKIAVFVDMTEEIREKNQIARERDTDILTGLYNRRAFYRIMDWIAENPQERKDAVVILCDLDLLKKVNDEYGHLCGNQYITAFSGVLHSYESDTKIMARMGGDEFLFVVYGLDGEEEAKKVVEWLQSSRDIKKVVMPNGEEIRLQFSMGYAYYAREDLNYQDLIRLADERMYKEKKRRKAKQTME